MKTAILAGQGRLPHLIIEKLTPDNGVIITFNGQPAVDFSASKLPHINLPIGKIQRIIDTMHQNNVTQVVFAGAIQRPALSDLAVDIRGAKIIAKLAMNKTKGDNTLLSILMSELEKEGIIVIGANMIRPDLSPSIGILSKQKPSKTAQNDIELGFTILNTLSPFDIGQAIITCNGQVLGIEGVEGTDELINRLSPYIKKYHKHEAILIKSPKINQDLRLDMPTIGVQTVTALANAGAKGIAIKANQTIILDQNEVIKQSNQHKIFIISHE